MVHYWIGNAVNVDNFECDDYQSDLSAGVIRMARATDDQGPVLVAQYYQPWRILIRPKLQ